MKKLLWLDDVRDPFVMSQWLLEWAPEYYYEMDEGTHEVIWVKHYDGFVDWIQENGLPTEIGFDHDLGRTLSGMDCAKWLVDYCIHYNKEIPQFFVQSANPVGKQNIITFLNNAKKHI